MTGNFTVASSMGVQTWAMITSLALAFFLAARAMDTYRHRLRRDRELASEYRRAMQRAPMPPLEPATVAARNGIAGRGPTQQRLLVALTNAPGAGPSALADAIGITPNAASQALRGLERAGLVKRTGQGWQATQAGR